MDCNHLLCNEKKNELTGFNRQSYYKPHSTEERRGKKPNQHKSTPLINNRTSNMHSIDRFHKSRSLCS